MSDEFKSDSRILEMVTGDLYEGVVLDSLNEVRKALRIYAGGKLRIAEAIRKNLERIETPDKEFLRNPSAFSDIEGSVLSSLSEKGRYASLISDEGFGTLFYESIVNVAPVEGKYVLDIRPFQLDQEANIDLSKVMFRQRALSSGNISLLMGFNGERHFSIDLKDVLSGLFIDDKIMSEYAHYLSQNYCSDFRNLSAPQIVLDDGGSKYMLSLEFILNPLEPGAACSQCEISSEGTRLVGSAYKVPGEEKQGFAPELGLSIAMYEASSARPSVTLKEISETLAERDLVYDTINERHF